MNGREKCTLRVPRRALECLSRDDALEMALTHESVHTHTANRKIIQTLYELIPSYRATINIITERSDLEKERKMEKGKG